MHYALKLITAYEFFLENNNNLNIVLLKFKLSSEENQLNVHVLKSVTDYIMYYIPDYD